MFRRILGALGIGAEPAGAPAAAARHDFAIRPYRDDRCNFIYNLLFCDDHSLFAPSDEGPWPVVLADSPDADALRAIADDAEEEGRVRMLAYNRLREMGQMVPEKVLLGVIVEVPLEGGLDVLAAFTDGGVRYINHSEKMSFVEGDTFPRQVGLLLEASRRVVERIGPWTEARLPPPSRGMVRMSFLVSDGLYFGQGPMDEMVMDPIGGPVIGASHELLQGVVDASLRQQGSAD